MTDPIEHIVVLMMENRSFDQMLGCMKEVYPGLEGVDRKNPFCNPDFPNGTTNICQKSETRDITEPDPKHDVEDVLHQLDAPGKCQGFVANYAASHGDKEPFDHSSVMCYFPRGSLGTLHTLAESFCICDHWHSSLPGPTWPNRFFVTTGTSLGHIDMPAGVTQPALHVYDQDTIFTQLGERGKKWVIYHGDFPQTLLLTRLWQHPFNFQSLNKFFQHAGGSETDFPAFSFLEPVYFNKSGDQNDQHPPTRVSKGEALIAQVYNAIRGNDALWKKTLLIVLYDEHGGFADHVWTVPKAAVPPDDNIQNFSFDRYGLRVPAILISPWIEKGFESTLFDHTSVLRYLADKWGVQQLGNRTRAATSFGDLLTKLNSPRADTPARIEPPSVAMQLTAPREPVVTELNDNQKALYLFAEFLESKMSTVESGEAFREAFRARSLRAMTGPADAGAVATERAQQFLSHLQAGRIPRIP
jgi:phospholipase C